MPNVCAKEFEVGSTVHIYCHFSLFSLGYIFLKNNQFFKSPIYLWKTWHKVLVQGCQLAKFQTRWLGALNSFDQAWNWPKTGQMAKILAKRKNISLPRKIIAMISWQLYRYLLAMHFPAFLSQLKCSKYCIFKPKTKKFFFICDFTCQKPSKPLISLNLLNISQKNTLL